MTELLRAQTKDAPIGVDREARIIRGMVLAQVGPFKTPGRGEFDTRALQEIVRLAKEHPSGLKSRFTHPLDRDGLGSFLGRVKDLFLDRTSEPAKVRGDLHLDPTAFETPNGDLGSYVLNLAESDPDAFGASLALRAGREYRIDKQGRQLTNERGEPLPPLWRPLKLQAADIVDTGDAVDGLLGMLSDAQPLNDEAEDLATEHSDESSSSIRARVQTRQRLL